MNFTTEHLEGKTILEPVYCAGTCGIGLLTYIAMAFCNIFGCECGMYSKKIDYAADAAMIKLEDLLSNIENAAGVMDLKYQLSGRTVLVSGLAYAEKVKRNQKQKISNNNVESIYSSDNSEKPYMDELRADITPFEFKKQLLNMSDSDLELILADQRELYSEEELFCIEEELKKRK